MTASRPRTPDDRHASTDDLPAQGHTGVSSTVPGWHYEIRVQGTLDQRWTAWFDGLQVSSDASQTVICGQVADQAALHGLLNKICGLGLVLISLRRLDPDVTFS
jgi:hypothetical protein